MASNAIDGDAAELSDAIVDEKQSLLGDLLKTAGVVDDDEVEEEDSDEEDESDADRPGGGRRARNFESACWRRAAGACGGRRGESSREVRIGGA